MKIGISSAISMLFITFICIILVNTMSFNQQIAKANDYHYGTVNEIESSDFADSVVNRIRDDRRYETTIENKSVKDDLRIYQVMTKATIKMPIFGYSQTYIKESTAR